MAYHTYSGAERIRQRLIDGEASQRSSLRALGFWSLLASRCWMLTPQIDRREMFQWVVVHTVKEDYLSLGQCIIGPVNGGDVMRNRRYISHDVHNNTVCTCAR